MQRPVLKLGEPPTHPQARRVWGALYGWFGPGEFTAVEASMCLVEELGVDHTTAIKALQRLSDMDAVHMTRALVPGGLLKPIRDPNLGTNGHKAEVHDVLLDLTELPYDEI